MAIKLESVQGGTLTPEQLAAAQSASDLGGFVPVNANKSIAATGAGTAADATGGNIRRDNTVRGDGTQLGVAADFDTQLADAGFITPLTKEQIEMQKTQQKSTIQAQADALFGGQIRRSEELGEAQVSTARGSIGQTQGFNITSAEQSFVNMVESNAQARVEELEQKRAAFVAEGNFNAAQLAQQAINNTNQTLLQINQQKNTLAQQQVENVFRERGIGLQERQIDISEKNAADQLAVSLAGLTGEFEGSPTFAAKQADVANALAEANLTGFYNGEETFANTQAALDRALRERGIEINEEQLAETIRSNKVQEGLSRSRLAQEDVEPTPSSIVNDSIKRIKSLSDSGELNDVNYLAELNEISGFLGWDPDAIGELRSVVNRATEGDSAALQMLQANAEQEMGSDFATTRTGQTGADIIGGGLGQAVGGVVSGLEAGRDVVKGGLEFLLTEQN